MNDSATTGTTTSDVNSLLARAPDEDEMHQQIRLRPSATSKSNYKNNNPEFNNRNINSNKFSQKTSFEFDLKHLCVFCFVLPLGALVTCIALSIYKDFHTTNRTHCNVYNFFPSISAAISQHYPQSTIWRICIGVDSFPRFLIACIHSTKYYLDEEAKLRHMKYAKLYTVFVKLAFAAHFVELSSLLVLTYVSSVEMFVVHACGFVSFLISSTFYMLATILTYYWPRNHQHQHQSREIKSHALKFRVFLVYLTCLLGSFYFYVRHNRYCEPKVYSCFAVCEYLTVLANISYHTIIMHDLSLLGNGNGNQYKEKRESYLKITLIELKKDFPTEIPIIKN